MFFTATGLVFVICLFNPLFSWPSWAHE